MIAIIFGIISFIFAAAAIIPFERGLGWTEEFLFVLKGIIPLMAIGLGFLSIMVGIADQIDKRHAKKEALLQKEFEESNKNSADK